MSLFNKKNILSSIFVMGLAFSSPDKSAEDDVETSEHTKPISINKVYIRERNILGDFNIVDQESGEYVEIFSQLVTSQGKFGDSLIDRDAEILKKIYGEYPDVSVEKIFGEVALVFDVERSAYIRKVVPKSSSDIINKEVVRYAAKLENSIITRTKIQEVSREILKEIAGKGFYDAIVNYSIDECESGNYVIEFYVDPNISFEVKQIKLSGDITQEECNAISYKLDLKTRDPITKLFEEGVVGTFSLAIVVRNIEVLQEFFKDAGYVDANVTIHLNEDNNTLSYVVNKGERYVIKQVEVLGNTSVSDDEIQKMTFMISEAKVPYSEKYISTVLDIIRKQYLKIGKIDTKISVKVESVEEQEVSLIAEIEEGDISSIGQVIIVGNDRSGLDLILGDFQVYPGGPINVIMLDRAVEKMKSRGMYKDVSYFFTDSVVPGRKDITIVLKEKKSFKLFAGLELLNSRSLKVNASLENVPRLSTYIKYLSGRYGYEVIKGDGVAVNIGMTFAGKFWKNYSLDMTIVDRMVGGSSFSRLLDIILYRHTSLGFYETTENRISPGFSWVSGFDRNSVIISGKLEVAKSGTSIDRRSADLLYREQAPLQSYFDDYLIGATFGVAKGGFSSNLDIKMCTNTSTVYSVLSMHYEKGISLIDDIVAARFKSAAYTFVYLDSSDKNINDTDGIPMADHITIGPMPSKLVFRGLKDSRTLYDAAINKYILPKSAALLSGEIVFLPSNPISPVIFADLVISSKESAFGSINSAFGAWDSKRDKKTAIFSCGLMMELNASGSLIQFGFVKVFNANNPSEDVEDIIVTIAGFTAR